VDAVCCSTAADFRNWSASVSLSCIAKLLSAAYQIIQGKGATLFAVAAGLLRITEAMLCKQNTVLSVSSLVQDFYGISAVCLSLPTVINRGRCANVCRHPPRLRELEKEIGLAVCSRRFPGQANEVGNCAVRSTCLAVVHSPISCPMITEPKRAVPGVVALPAIGAWNKAANVHALAIKVFGNSKARATTTGDEEHAHRIPFLLAHLQGFSPRSKMRP
jgi:hypothetical protein